MEIKKRRYAILYILLFLFFSNSVHSSTIIECLGREELLLHKQKNIDPIYKLNQLFIDKFTAFGELEIKDTYLTKICKLPHIINNSNSVSYKLLKTLVLNGQRIFNFNKIKGSQGTVSFRISTIKEFSNDSSLYIFFDYLSSLEALLLNAKCLEKNIPEVKYFRDRLKHLEGEFPIRKLFNERKKVLSLLSKLEKFKTLRKLCY